jgi:hypothetical protein
MRRITQPWKLCRIFGAQPVGTVGAPRCPKAGIAAQVIPPQSSRRTFRGKVDTDCRPADLPTCRIWVLDFSDSSEVPTTFNSKVGARRKSLLQAMPALPMPSHYLDVFSNFTARHNLPQFSLSDWNEKPTEYTNYVSDKLNNDSKNPYILVCFFGKLTTILFLGNNFNCFL